MKGLYTGDCLEVMRSFPENSIDTCITDPPYHLTSIVKRFGGENAAPAQYGTDGAFARASKGFMGKTWDGGSIAFQPETWQAVFRVLKPGAILLAFGGTRTYHRMACAIEDAGFEIRDTIAWVYGSGFPKSLDIGKAIEAQMKTGRSSPKGQRMVAMGDEYEQTPLAGTPNYGVTGNFTNKDTGSKPMAITTPEGQLWHGYGTALKPAHEPIVLAMKPIDGTFANNALTWGVAGLWIDGGRVGTEGGTTRSEQAPYAESGWRTGHKVIDIHTGRFPANFVHDGSDEVMGLFPQSNGSKPIERPDGFARFNGKEYANGQVYNAPAFTSTGYEDSGSAARFFKQCKFSQEELWQLANIAEKSSSPQKSQDAFVQELAQILERHEVQLNEQALQAILDCIGSYSECIQSQSFAQCAERWANTDTIPTTQNRLKLSGYAQPATDEFTNSDKLARAEQKSEHSRFLYCPKASRSERNAGLEGMEERVKVWNGQSDKSSSDIKPVEERWTTKTQNHHPTVKPIELMRYLVRLTKTPTGGVVLDPFMGSGTTGIACALEGREFIGIEREQEYIEIAEKRIAYWSLQPGLEVE